jgi:hypothetical protein
LFEGQEPLLTLAATATATSTPTPTATVTASTTPTPTVTDRDPASTFPELSDWSFDAGEVLGAYCAHARHCAGRGIRLDSEVIIKGVGSCEETSAECGAEVSKEAVIKYNLAGLDEHCPNPA